jgi:hypothetical protein
VNNHPKTSLHPFAHTMSAAGGSQRGRDATASQRPPDTQTRAQTHQERPDGLCRKIIDGLKDVERVLASQDEWPTAKVQDLIRVAQALERALKTRAPPQGEWMARIEMKIDDLVKVKSKESPQGRTWAQVAAQQATRLETACQPQKHSVRLRLDDSQGRTPEEILKAVKPVIKGAYAVRTLRSGDVDVLVPDQHDRDTAVNQAETEGFRIIRQDYPVEVAGVPLDLHIEGGRAADNLPLRRDVATATGKIVPGVMVTRIRWLHDTKERENRRRGGKTRGTVIVCLATEAMRREVVKKGIVIRALHYEARLYSHGNQVKQCYNCNQWGHTQAACGKQARCGECAGSHQSRECPKQRVSCCNCGRAHRAWQRGECRTYQAYFDGIQARRAALYAQTASIRQENTAQAMLTSDGFEIMTSRKRGRPESPSPSPGTAAPPKKGRGRPTALATAARSRTQSRLRMSQAAHAEIDDGTMVPGTQASSTTGIGTQGSPPAADTPNMTPMDVDAATEADRVAATPDEEL